MNSLPFLTRLVAATITTQQNRVLLAEVAYLRTEVAYYREQLPPGTILRYTDTWRLRFARDGAAVGWKRLAEIATAVKAKTIQGWERLRKAGKLTGKRRGPGRPRLQVAIERVIKRPAQENPLWGQKRIAGILAMLLLPISPRTIATVLDRNGLKPAPVRSTDRNWKKFITDHLDCLVATDFFTVDVWTWAGKQTYDVLFAIHLATRKVEIMGVTQHSNEAYMVQTARNATMADTGWLKQVGCRYLIHDGDKKFCEAWKEILRGSGIKPKKIPPKSPNCNAFAERSVLTAKRAFVRRRWFLGYGGLRRALAEFVSHYNSERPHQSLGNRPLTGNPEAQAAAQKSIAKFKASDIRCVTRCDGTIRHYYRVAA